MKNIKLEALRASLLAPSSKTCTRIRNALCHVDYSESSREQAVDYDETSLVKIMINGRQGVVQIILVLLIPIMFPDVSNFSEARKGYKGHIRWCRKLQRRFELPTTYDEGGQYQWRNYKPSVSLNNAGSSVVLECRNVAYRKESFQRINLRAPYLIIRWTKNEHVVSARKRFKAFGCQNEPYIFGSKLRIKRVKTSDSGLYSCQIIRNDTGVVVQKQIIRMMVKNGDGLSPPVKRYDENHLSSINTYTNISCTNLTDILQLSCGYHVIPVSPVNVTWTQIFTHNGVEKTTLKDLQGEERVSVSCAASSYICDVRNSVGGFENKFFIDGPIPETVVAHRAPEKPTDMILLPFVLLLPIFIFGITIAINFAWQRGTRRKNKQLLGNGLFVERLEGNKLPEEVLDEVVEHKTGETPPIAHDVYRFTVLETFPAISKDAIELVATKEISRDRLESGWTDNVIGSGNFGHVFKGYLTADSGEVEAVAVKVLRDGFRECDFRALVEEAKTIIKSAQHENVISLVGTCILDATFDSILHRDLAARNILLTKQNVVKIGDFGLSKQMENKNYYRACTRREKPAKWTAPEALLYDKFSVASDVWSYGILLWEIFSLGDEPYPDVHWRHLYNLLRNGTRLTRPPFASREIYETMQRCWKWNSSERISFAETTNFFSSYKFSTDEIEVVRIHRNFEYDSPLNSDDSFDSNCYLAGLFSECDMEIADATNSSSSEYVPSEICFRDNFNNVQLLQQQQSVNVNIVFENQKNVFETRLDNATPGYSSYEASTSNTSSEKGANNPLLLVNQTYIRTRVNNAHSGYNENVFDEVERMVESNSTTNTNSSESSNESQSHYFHITV